MRQLTKPLLLEAIEREHALLMRELARVGPTRMAERGVLAMPAPGQSCQDLLAHLTEWERRMQQIVGAIAAGFPPPPYPATARFNEQIFQRHLDRPLAAICAEFDRSYADTLMLIQELPEDLLADEAVWKVVGYNTYSHYRWARTTIHRWLRLNPHLSAFNL